MQSTAILWNPATLDGEQLAWPAGIDALFDLGRGDVEQVSQASTQPGRIFDHHPALFRLRDRAQAGGGIGFNLLPLHLQGRSEGRERQRMASQILARAIKEMIEHHDAGLDWMLGGDFNAELAIRYFDVLGTNRFTPLSAQDETDGAFSYLRGSRSPVDHVFLSPNMSRLYGSQQFFTLARENSQVDYLKRFSAHRPVLVRLAACSAAVAGMSTALNPTARLPSGWRRCWAMAAARAVQ